MRCGEMLCAILPTTRNHPAADPQHLCPAFSGGHSCILLHAAILTDLGGHLVDRCVQLLDLLCQVLQSKDRRSAEMLWVPELLCNHHTAAQSMVVRCDCVSMKKRQLQLNVAIE